MKKSFVKRSIGTLRPAARNKERSPNLIGQITLLRSDFAKIERHFQDAERDEVVCGIAGWCYKDSGGQFITVQISPPYVKPRVVPTTMEAFLPEIDDDEDDTLPS